MLKPANKSRRNSEEGCFLRFYRQPWTIHGSVEVSLKWKYGNRIKMVFKNSLYDVGGIKLKQLQLFRGF